MKTDMRHRLLDEAPPAGPIPSEALEGPETQEAPWVDVVILCTKCASKRGAVDHKGRPTLRTVFKDAFKDLGVKKRVRVIETGCFGLCPKHGQTVAVGSELARGTLRVVEGEKDATRLAAVIAGRFGKG